MFAFFFTVTRRLSQKKTNSHHFATDFSPGTSRRKFLSPGNTRADAYHAVRNQQQNFVSLFKHEKQESAEAIVRTEEGDCYFWTRSLFHLGHKATLAGCLRNDNSAKPVSPWMLSMQRSFTCGCSEITPHIQLTDSVLNLTGNFRAVWFFCKDGAAASKPSQDVHFQLTPPSPLQPVGLTMVDPR